jgi:hydroxymethylglutaryl-CoA lyase
MTPRSTFARPVQIVEVGARDGLQNEPEVISTADKLHLIAGMIDAGVKRLEVASFVHPGRVPQMADAEAVIAGLPDRPDVSYIGLCLNKKGVLRGLATKEANKRGIDEAGCVIVASDTFGQRNQGQTIAEGLQENAAMLRLAREHGLVPQITISAAFGCPFEGEVPAQRVVDIARQIADAEPVEIALADTIGVGVPPQVRDLVGAVKEAIPAGTRLRAHFHNTRGSGIANAWAAYEAGVDVLDSSVGGLGGCPFAPGATGNIATEDLLYMLERADVRTDLTLEKVIDVARWFETVRGKPAVSALARAGGFPKSAAMVGAG